MVYYTVVVIVVVRIVVVAVYDIGNYLICKYN